MKTLFVVLVFMAMEIPAQADHLITLTDGTRVVWSSYYEKGDRFCTQKSMGEVCWAKSDVRAIKEVPDGTDASEYGVSSLGDENAAARRSEADRYNTNAVNDMAAHRERRDAEIARRISAEQERQNEERARKKKAEEASKRDESWKQRRYGGYVR
jgi:hypothetical protein